MRERVDSYALGALDDGERAAFEAHLEGCAVCRAALAETERAVALLPHVLAEAAPLQLPPALRASVLERVRREAQPAVLPVGRAGEGPPVRQSQSVRRAAWLGWLTWRAAVGVAAAAVLAVSLVWTAQLGVALARERALREELAQELANVSGQREIVLEVVDARDKTTRMLRPVPGAPREFATAYGKVHTRPDMPYVVAMTGRLPTPPPGQAYHLWLRQGGQTRLGGVLEIDAGGFAQLVFRESENGPSYDAVWLTLQPVAQPGATVAPGTTLLRWDPS